jgi:hypothetical protein
MPQRKLTRLERDYLKQLVVECMVQRFSREESLAFIHHKLKKDIGIDYMDKIFKYVRDTARERLNYLQRNKDAFLFEHFQRIDEIRKYQKELWVIAHTNTEDGQLRKNCISELHSLTITLHNLNQMLTEYTTSFGIQEQQEHSKEGQSIPTTTVEERDKPEWSV